MGLDIHVMPLCKFFAGEYESPLEKLKDILGPVMRIGTPKPDMPMEDAKEEVADLQKTLSEEFGTRSVWDDVGDPAFSEQFDFRAWHALRAFAAHQDYPAKKGLLRKEVRYFELENPESHPGIRKIWEGADSSYRHLVVHADNQGYYFPVKFEDPLLLDAEIGVVAGSSYALQAELAKLGKFVKAEKRWSDLRDRDPLVPDGDPMGYVKYGWMFMHHCATLSVDRGLPIIFDG